MIKGLLEFKGIRRRIMIFYLIITIIFAAVSLYSYFSGLNTLDKSKVLIQDYLYLNELDNTIETLETEVEQYLSTQSSESLINYYEIQNQLKEIVKSIPNKPSYDQREMLLKDIANMAEELLDESESAIILKRGNISNEYNMHFQRTVEIGAYIQSHITDLLNYQLEVGSDDYKQTSRGMFIALIIDLIFIITTIVVSLSVAVQFTYRLTRPIIELSHSAEKVAKGEFDVEPVEVHSEDEVNVLSTAFDKMVVNIKHNIEEIKKNAEIEKELKEKEMENLTMESLLKETELKMLQSQINPHFLFNTLNAASQLSIMEGADRTSVFIEKLAELFRYSLRNLNEPITLEEEVGNVDAYMYILKTRFGNKIQFKKNIDASVLAFKIPCMIIQPMVENAYIHGLEDLERPGEITLNIFCQEEMMTIEIHDNGKGMEPLQVQHIMQDLSGEELEGHHVTGIGIRNVIERLKIYYNLTTLESFLSIESEEDKGTKIAFRIPYEKGGLSHG
ncbi:MAG: histidine kinase [Clostridia bacterium]|nr:histidine kinase [Clostridia bacterium]